MRNIINISLPSSLKKEVDKAVRHGRYATRSEFFRELLRRKGIEEEQYFFDIALKSGVFGFYRNEPDLYSEDDIKEKV